MQKAGALEITWNHSISVFTYCQMGIQCTRNTYFLLKHRLLQNNSTTFSWYFSTWHNRRSVEFSFFFQAVDTYAFAVRRCMDGSRGGVKLFRTPPVFDIIFQNDVKTWKDSLDRSFEVQRQWRCGPSYEMDPPFLNVIDPCMRCTNSWLSNENTIDIPT